MYAFDDGVCRHHEIAARFQHGRVVDQTARAGVRRERREQFADDFEFIGGHGRRLRA